MTTTASTPPASQPTAERTMPTSDLQNDPAEPIDLVWEAPTPGQWMLDTTHHGRRPLTAFGKGLDESGFSHIATLFATYGLPLAGMDTREVNGCTYIRPRGVGEPEKPSTKQPPTWLMRIVARVHPEMRRRNRAAAQAWADKRWRDDVDAWFDHERSIAVAANLRLGAVDLRALDDDALLAHLGELVEHCRHQARRNMETHGGDLIPVGDWFAHCADWGIDVHEAAALLQGASPASVEAVRMLAPVREALDAADDEPASVDELRALDPACDAAVDEWLAHFGWRLLDSTDLDATTLAERPELHLDALLAAARVSTSETAPSPDALRANVPADQCALFDELLGEARYGLRLRDDNAGIRWHWSGGLLRRALLEIGRRLVDTGHLHDAEHAVELDPGEVAPLLVAGSGPDADAVAARRACRLAIEAAEPPSLLGDPEPPPPLEALPPAMARAARAMLASIDAMQGDMETVSGQRAAAAAGAIAGNPSSLHGVGIGTAVVEGRAVVVRHAGGDKLAELAPGDILIAPFTGPAYNSVLAIAGGVVVEEGGAMCHAAIVAREFGLSAAVGVDGATTHFHDGDQVRLDPTTGTIERIA